MDSDLGNKFLFKSDLIETSPFKTHKVVCLYFTASWCPPCQGFCPLLIDFYNDINSTEKQLEIILVSRDQNKDDFEEYYAQMPWLALPFNDDRIPNLAEKYGIKGIPILLVLKKNGEVATKTGKMDVTNEGSGAFDKWVGLMN